MKSKSTTKVKRGWVVLGNNYEWTDQITTVMSLALRKFYRRSKYVKLLPCTISYSPPKKKAR